MSKQAYEAVLPEAQALPKEKIKNPYMPLDTFFQEAENLYVQANKDKALLMQKGLSKEILTRLMQFTDAGRYAQSLWMGEIQSREKATEEWAEKSPVAFDFVNQLLHTFRYAHRNNEQALKMVDQIAEGYGNDDMVQDLSDCGVLARKYPEELTAISFDMAEIERAESLAGEMANLLALANGDKMEENETLIIRNQIYSILKDLVDEVRDCGKYVFWRDKKRVKAYSSEYNRKKKH